MISELMQWLESFDDSKRLFRLQAEGELSGLLIQAWSQKDALSEPYQLELVCLSTERTLDTKAMLGQRVGLITTLADGSEHVRGGMVYGVTAEDADGSLTRYRLEVGPWLRQLAYSTHSRVWQDKSIQDIVESIFASYQGGQWRWADDVADHLALSPQLNAEGQRSYCVQFRETDLAFVQRLLTEEGLIYRFEAIDQSPDALVILADTARAESCPEDAASASLAGGTGIRYHRDAQVEEQDVILALGAKRQFPIYTLSTLGWDYKTKRVLSGSVPTIAAYGSGNAPQLEAYEPAGAYPYLDGTRAQRAATVMQEAHEARHKTWLGRGTVRSLSTGQHFKLQDSPLDNLAAWFDEGGEDQNQFLITQVIHAGINNLPQQLSEAIAKAGFDPKDYYAEPILPTWIDPDQRAQAAKSGYANRFEAIRQKVPWRAQTVDEHGARLNPRPTATMQTALVVGPQGETSAGGAQEIHMDRLGRVRIQYEFQRQSAHPATSMASTWVRVLQRWAGPGMGLQFIPRIGQEVLVDFYEGDIDRPYVLCAMHNGTGEAGVPVTPGGADAQSDVSAFAKSSDHSPSAQGNLAGGNSPAWHGASAAGLDAEGQANAAALSGFKTKEFGGAGFNQLVFDDTDTQLRVQLHTSQHSSQLNLGHLIHQADNHRGGLRGQGFELRTDAYGSIRATQGVLLTSYGSSPQEPAGDNAAGLALQGQLKTLAQVMSDAATTHQTVSLASHLGSFRAGASSAIEKEAPQSAMLTILKGMVGAKDLPQAQADAAKHNTSTADKLPHPSEPIIAISAKAGLVQVAGQHIEAAAGETLSLAAGQDIHQAVGGSTRIHTGQAIGMLAGAVKPGDQAAGKGITVIAGQGKIDVQAQSDSLTIAAKNDLKIQSQSAHIDWAAAKKIVLATAGGASITIEGGNVSVMCPGTITVKAGKKSFVGPQTYAQSMNVMPGPTKFDEEFQLKWPHNDEPVRNRRFEIVRDDGSVVRGSTNGDGMTGLQKSEFFETTNFKLLSEL